VKKGERRREKRGERGGGNKLLLKSSSVFLLSTEIYFFPLQNLLSKRFLSLNFYKPLPSSLLSFLQKRSFKKENETVSMLLVYLYALSVLVLFFCLFHQVLVKKWNELKKSVEVFCCCCSR